MLRLNDAEKTFDYRHFLSECNVILTILLIFVTDYVYFESSSNSPYHIRRIEELNKVILGRDIVK